MSLKILDEHFPNNLYGISLDAKTENVTKYLTYKCHFRLFIPVE